VADSVALKSARTAEWFLQSDIALTNAGNDRLRVSFASPEGVAITTREATVKSPGSRGSIEKGPEEQRGYVLRASARAALTHAVDVTLELQKPR
jgi:hypothetical protein